MNHESARSAKGRRILRPRRGRPARGLAMLAIAAVLIALAPVEAFAKGGFRGGGFRVSPSRSLSAPRISIPRSTAAPSLKGWGSATRPSGTSAKPRLVPSAGGTVSGSSWSSSRSVYDTARRNGTLFSSKTEAQSAFRNSYQSQYRSTFASEPSSRPTWIPQSTQVGGRSVNVLYNAGLGGYGYIDPLLGTWVLYDAFRDAAMLDSLMNNHSYYYGAPVYLSHGPGFLSSAIGLLVAFVVLNAVLRAARRRMWR